MTEEEVEEEEETETEGRVGVARSSSLRRRSLRQSIVAM